MVSFPLLLAISQGEFCDRYIHPFVSASTKTGPLVTVPEFLFVCAGASLACTVGVVVLIPEKNPGSTKSVGESGFNSFAKVKRGYGKLYRAAQLPAVQRIFILFGICRIGFIATDTVTKLRFIEASVAPHTLAIAMVLQFPIEVIIALWASRLIPRTNPSQPTIQNLEHSNNHNHQKSQGKLSGNDAGVPDDACMRIWVRGLRALTVPNFVLPITVYLLETRIDKSHLPAFPSAIALASLWVSSAGNKMMFVAQGHLFNRIADPEFGGSSLALLEAASLFGWSWPKTACYLVSSLVGYYPSAIGCLVIGVAILPYLSKSALHIASLRAEEFRDR
eukprot:c2176_g1_i1.p1 GENE.c2176_g1_i1~~c2176_g1_i1.p1  ORF type:complete len:350 (+),score=63.37 c2176_g1_i1:49-1050(+)